jgi:NAD(P)-dependent dehydrogenase (short-subunit alcohol dehydrogenase family)
MSDTKIVLIAGVGPIQGLGASVALRFARAGLQPVLGGRTESQLAAVAAAVEQAGGRAHVVATDVTVEAQVAALVAAAEKLGPVQAAVYNAAAFTQAPSDSASAKSFEDTWRVSCFGGFVFAREAVKPMLARGRGTLLFTGASASLRGRPHFAAMAAAKAGLRAVSQSFAREFGPRGIHVAHIVVDGVIDHERLHKIAPDLARSKGPDGLLDPTAIAETYWQLHAQPRSAWTQELDLRPFNEPF